MDTHTNQTRAALQAIETWVFDLDNTLYPVSARLFVQVDQKISGFIAQFFGVDKEEARRIQKEYFVTYGTTLRGLMTQHNVEPVEYMNYVHDIDLTSIEPNVALGAALDRLPGQKVIFTNASAEHAERVTGKLGIRDRFDAIYDIVDADYIPKPAIGPYEDVIRRFSIDPAKAVMVEDMARNLEPAAALGMTTVWVQNDNAWALDGSDKPYIHHVAHDLTQWLSDAADLR